MLSQAYETLHRNSATFSSKMKDFFKLCQDFQIPHVYHGVYNNLPSEANVRDALAEPKIQSSENEWRLLQNVLF